MTRCCLGDKAGDLFDVAANEIPPPSVAIVSPRTGDRLGDASERQTLRVELFVQGFRVRSLHVMPRKCSLTIGSHAPSQGNHVRSSDRLPRSPDRRWARRTSTIVRLRLRICPACKRKAHGPNRHSRHSPFLLWDFAERMCRGTDRRVYILLKFVEAGRQSPVLRLVLHVGPGFWDYRQQN